MLRLPYLHLKQADIEKYLGELTIGNWQTYKQTNNYTWNTNMPLYKRESEFHITQVRAARHKS